MSDLFPVPNDNRGLSIDRGIGAGTLLVSSPSINSDYFQRTVVLIAERTATGHMGLVLNRQTIAEVRTALVQHGMEWPYQDFMYEGGPVNRSSMIMLHSREFRSQNTLDISHIAAMSSDKLMFEKMCGFDVPQRRKFVFGQCVWLEGQLEREIKQQRSWLTTRANERILWDIDGEELWHHAIEMCAKSTMDQFL